MIPVALSFARALAVSLCITVALHAQTAHVRFTSLSVILQPTRDTTNSLVLFSTPTPLGGSFPTTPAGTGLVGSGELAPMSGVNGSYGTQFAAVAGGVVRETGSVGLVFPFADTNGNLLADFLEVERDSSISISGTSVGASPAGEMRSYRVDGAFSRQADSDQGTYRLVFTPTVQNPAYSGFAVEGTFLVITNDAARSRLLYERGSRPNDANGFRMELRDYGSDIVTSGSTHYRVGDTNRIDVESLTLTEAGNDPIVFGPFSLHRSGNRYLGSPGANDGLRSTPWNDFTSWHVEIIDTNDLDANGVPDFSDTQYRTFDFTLLTQPNAGSAGRPLLLTADTRGLPFSRVTWSVGQPSTGLRIPIAGNAAGALRLDPFIPFLTPQWFVGGPGFETIMEVEAIVAGPADVSAIAKRITFTQILGQPLAEPGRRGGLSSTWESKPFAYFNTTIGVVFGADPVVLRPPLSEGALVYLSAAFLPSPIQAIDGPAFTLHLRGRASIDLPPDGIAIRVSGHGSAANSHGTLRLQLTEATGREIATAAVENVLLEIVPLLVIDDGLNVRVYAGADRQLVLEGTTRHRNGQSLAFTGQPSANGGQLSTANVTVYDAPWLTAARPSRLINMSTRGVIGPGDQTMIFGAVVRGSKPVLVRALGPALEMFGIGDAVANPQLTVYGGSTVLASNDDWESSPDPAVLRATFANVGAFPLAAISRDAATVLNLSTGAYTAVVENTTGATGTALIELYDTEREPGLGRLSNLSTRGFVQGAQRPITAGLVVNGPAARTVLIRGVGPALRRFGIEGFLANPLLQIFDATGHEVARNDRWNATATNRSLVSMATTRVSTFSLDTFGEDAALVIILPPGSYTVQLSGVANSAGVALVEIYDLN